MKEYETEKKKAKTAQIPVEKLHDFENHPYKVKDDADMDNLVESIQSQGVISPLIVRMKDGTIDEFDVVSGHRRLHASKRAGLKTVPALICPFTKTEAMIALVDSNLHREHLLPSEKAFAYKMKMEAMKEQGKRTDLTLSQVATKTDTAAEIGKAANDSLDQVFRHIRLTNLISELLDLVDENRIGFTPAVELSYLSEQEQQYLLETIQSEDRTPSLSQAQSMKKASQEGKLDADKIIEIMSEEKPNQKEMFKVPIEKIRKYVPKGNEKQLADFVIKACEHYQKFLMRQRNRDER